jgi:hypothetical protein
MHTLLTQDMTSASWGPSIKVSGPTHFQVTGTWSGSVSCQVSYNNVEWMGFLTTTVNTDKLFEGNDKWYRFGFQSYTSGTATCTLYQSEAESATAAGSSSTGIINTTASITLTTSDLGKNIRVTSSSSRTVTLPSVDASNDGSKVRITKLGSGNVIIQAADSDLIGDSTAGGTCTNSTSTETYAYLDLEYVDSAVKWLMSGSGTWTTA